MQQPIFTDNATIIGDGSSAHPLKGGALLKVLTRRISSAEILSMSAGAAAVELVPAPGSGLAIFPVRINLNYEFVTTKYTIGGGGGANMAIGWGLTAAEVKVALAFLAFDSPFLDQTADFFQIADPNTALTQPMTRFEDIPIRMECDDALSLGDGTMVANILYALVPVR